MRMVFGTIGDILFWILRWLWKLVLGVLKVSLELVKIILLVSGLVLRLFLAFVRAGTL